MSARDRSRGHPRRYHDGRTGWGDVGWHENRHVQELQALIERPEQAEGIPLGDRSGSWLVYLKPSARLREVRNNIGELVRDATAEGLIEIASRPLVARSILDHRSRPRRVPQSRSGTASATPSAWIGPVGDGSMANCQDADDPASLVDLVDDPVGPDV